MTLDKLMPTIALLLFIAWVVGWTLAFIATMNVLFLMVGVFAAPVAVWLIWLFGDTA